MTEIKICGITNLEDAKNAIIAGASHLGFIFVSKSPRAISEEFAGEILPQLRSTAKTVAVFKDSPLDEVNRIAKSLEFDFVQLHGSESPEFCGQVNFPVIKALEINPTMSVEELSACVEQYADCHAVLFDKPKQLQLDSWLENAVEKVADLKLSSRYFFAGGLTQQNVKQVVSRLEPPAVDVASGVETAPGKKDSAKMVAFCSAIKNRSDVTSEAVS